MDEAQRRQAVDALVSAAEGDGAAVQDAPGSARWQAFGYGRATIGRLIADAMERASARTA